MSEAQHLAQLTTAARDLVSASIRRLATRKEMGTPEGRERVQRILDAAPPDAIAHPPLRVIERHRLSIRRGLSFRTIMIQRSEARHAGVHDRGWLLDNKNAGYAFADAIGVRRPAAQLTPSTLDSIEPRPPMVIKPTRSTGGRGVFLIQDEDHIIDVRSRQTLSSWGQLMDRARALMTNTTRRVGDRWITEELVLDEHGAPARDLKFFAFYGQVLFVQEIERLPEFRATFWDPNGQPIQTGKPASLENGYGITADHIKLAEQVSAAIPHPFMRIDTLRASPDDLVIGEFTPRPGQFEQFDESTDRLLAEAWVRAERRLLDDALGGKSFSSFEEATSGPDGSSTSGTATR
ncbi:ATP-grasp fold amidoligase family protein [Phytoactinopolyspora endophytica]|uniref:ATP-grasp fold amidoligase family protein n=1 Tax=Phytoactinopolyspora endophytica TaxID=1642495 RepID=UPI00101CA22D|nr:ATP-grasp fold amidoligase family protein [Phytoactinopolyspora endophytica]